MLVLTKVSFHRHLISCIVTKCIFLGLFSNRSLKFSILAIALLYFLSILYQSNSSFSYIDISSKIYQHCFSIPTDENIISFLQMTTITLRVSKSQNTTNTIYAHFVPGYSFCCMVQYQMCCFTKSFHDISLGTY